MATTKVVNFSLDPALCAGLKAQSLIEDRPMSRIVSKLLAQYLATCNSSEAWELADT